jgi:L-malate glycosyltransferase
MERVRNVRAEYMNITFVSTMAGTPWTGSEELWAAAASEAVAEGHAVTASVFRWPSVAPQLLRLQDAGVRLLWRRRFAPPTPDELAMKAMNLLGGRPFERTVRMPAIGARGATASFHAIKASRPAIICLSQGSPYDLMDAPRSRSMLRLIVSSGLPYVIICQSIPDASPHSRRVREEVIALYAGARFVGFVAHQNLRTAERHFARNLENAVVLRNPINLVEASELSWPATGSPLRLACVGRLEVVQKSQDILLEALSRPEWRERDWTLRLFGTGPDEDYLRDLARHYGLGARVTFGGYVSDVRSIWADHHLLLLPSRAEGTPLALVEAMMCGRPAVATDVGGNSEWVTDGASGYIAAAASVPALASALERAWSERDRWQAIGAAARTSALEKVDPAAGATLTRMLVETARQTS